MELADFITGDRPWEQLFRLLEGLPPFSRYKKALQDDDEAAANYLEWKEEQERQGIPLPPASTPLSEWTAEREQTTALVNQFLILQYMYSSAHSKGAGNPPKLLKGPKTAIERAELAREERMREGISNRMLRGRG